MSFSISKLIVDGNQIVVGLDWTYTHPAESISNQHMLLKPYGNTSLAEVTEAVAIGWLEEQLAKQDPPVTAKSLDEQITKSQSDREYAEGLVTYTSDGSGAYAQS
tara:strand:- start:2713 stop:3027 length:315 start_codon:yes stop_codon:yes gene_type:complete